MRKLFAVLAVCLVLLPACDSKDTTEPPPTPTVTLVIGTATAEITQAGTLSVPVTITRGGGFTGAVTVTATGVNGVTVGSATIPSGSTAGTLTLTADAAAAPGAGTLTFTAAGPGGTPSATATLALTVRVRGTYALTPAVPTLTLVQGASGNVTIHLARAGSFGGVVTLAAQAPAGLTATITPTALSGATASAVLAVTAGAAVAPGTYPVTVTGTTPGLGNQAATVNVTVTAAGSYTLGLTPATLSLAAGATGSSSLAINRVNNFAGTVNLTATAPAGITATVTPAAATGNTATLDVSVGAAVAPGSYTVTVNGTATGVANQSATLALTVTPAGTYTLALTPATLSLAAGANGSSSIAINRQNGFAGTVNLTATAPTGVTATVSPAAATGSTATLNVAVGAAVLPGSYTVTVNGTATGVANQSVTLNLTVTAAGSFTLALNPAAATVQQGAGTTSTVSITRTGGFTGDVALTATAPTGVTVSFTPATLSGATTSAQMTVNVGAAVTAGPASITVRANATGLAEQTAPFALTVTTGGGGGGNVTWSFCGFSGVPVWVAGQDGDGAWMRVNGDASNRFSFQVSSGRGGIAYVTAEAGGGFQTQVFFGTTAELQAQGSALCMSTTGTGKTVTGRALGVTSTFDMGFITLGQSQAQVTSASMAFTLHDVLDGPLDLIATRQAGVISGTGINFTPNSLIIRRNLNVANGDSVATIDFATGLAPATAQLTFANAGADWTGSIGLYYTPRNTTALLYTDVGLASSATRTWYGFPASARQPGELHIINAMATVPTTGSLTQTRQVLFVTADVANRTVTFGAPLNAPTVSVVSTTPYVRLRLEYTPQTEYNRYFTTDFQQGSAAAFRDVQIQKTAAHVAAGGGTRLEIPDFTSAAGWNNTWALAAGALTTWTFSASGWSGGDGVTSPLFVEGAVMASASRMGQITP